MNICNFIGHKFKYATFPYSIVVNDSYGVKASLDTQFNVRKCLRCNKIYTNHFSCPDYKWNSIDDREGNFIKKAVEAINK